MAAVKQERNNFGRFFYRLPSGESGSDVYDRVSSFLESLYRVFNAPQFNPDTSVIIVTHGLTLRLFLMRWFRWPVSAFEQSWNPGNAQFVEMRRNDRGSLELTPSSAQIIGMKALGSIPCPAEHIWHQFASLSSPCDMCPSTTAQMSSAGSIAAGAVPVTPVASDAGFAGQADEAHYLHRSASLGSLNEVEQHAHRWSEFGRAASS